MKVLVIGSGGREHAICWRLRHSESVTHVFCAPGSDGIGMTARCLDIAVTEIDKLITFVKENQIDVTVVGPELPLSLGIVDAFQKEQLRIFGASKAASELESSKAFAKKIMNDAGVPTGRYSVVTSAEAATAYVNEFGAPVVLKADGLAAGKGVFVCHTVDEALLAVASLYAKDSSARVVCEEFLEGIEVSYIIATDGDHIIPMAPSHDYKRIFDNDQGPNTGGMGSVCPTPRFTPEQEEFVLHHVMVPTIAEMKHRGTPFSGFLYAGLMISPKGEIKVLEFNTRLGDPETQSIMRRLESDLGQMMYMLCDVQVNKTRIVENLPAPLWSPQPCVCLVLASAGYPDSSSAGDVIEGIALAESLPNTVVFHAGTKLDGALLKTAGGRVLSVTATGNTVAEARQAAYKAADMIQFKGRQLRRDIGLQ